jgi:hypothetical protein
MHKIKKKTSPKPKSLKHHVANANSTWTVMAADLAVRELMQSYFVDGSSPLDGHGDAHAEDVFFVLPLEKPKWWQHRRQPVQSKPHLNYSEESKEEIVSPSLQNISKISEHLVRGTTSFFYLEIHHFKSKR